MSEGAYWPPVWQCCGPREKRSRKHPQHHREIRYLEDQPKELGKASKCGGHFVKKRRWKDVVI